MALRRHRQKDPVTPELRLEVFQRDGGCVAVKYDASEAHRCRGPLTYEHVPERWQNGLGVRAPSNKEHGLTHCRFHAGLDLRGGESWNTAHREWQNDHLDETYPDRHERLCPPDAPCRQAA